MTRILFAVTVATWLGLEVRQSLRRRSEARVTDRGSYLATRVCVGAGLVVAAFATSVVPDAAIGGQPVPFVVGLVVAWAGIALRWWSFHTLGRYFTFRVQTSADQPVISSGPYHLLRHPGYTGAELEFLGLGFLYGNWAGVAALAVLPMIGLIYRIRVEEDALDAALGERYRTYASSRKRMIPFVW